MAIVTGDLYKGFTFGDISSKAYGVYITQEAAYNAPERDVSVYEIAGRNGAYVLDNGRFRNITVTYKCGIALDSETDFEAAIRVFRNALASQAGKYVRLTDEYNPNEFRQAAFFGGIEVEMADKRAGEFNVSFDCKPQRFLISGKIPRTIGGSVTNTQTKSGAVVSIDSDGGDKATSLLATIEAIQAGSGDPSPTNVRAITGWTEAKVFDTWKNLVDESTATGFNAAVTVDGGYISVTKNASSNYPAAHIDAYLRAGVTYTVSATCVQATAQARLAIRDIAPSSTTVINVAYSAGGQRKSVTYTPTKSGTYRIALFSSFGAADSNTAIFTDVQCEIGSVATAYEHYTGTTTTTALGRTVYGGTVDVVTGVLTVTWLAARIGALAWGYNSSGNYFYTSSVSKKTGAFNILSDIYATATVDDVARMGDYHIKGSAANNNVFVTDSRYTTVADFKTANDQRYIYVEAATPQTYQLTTHEVELLAGQNNVWADTGDISITYGHDPNKIVNPTLFESRPLLEVNGYGDIDINGETVTVQDIPIGEVTIAQNTSRAGVLNGTTAVVRTTATIVEGLLETGDTFTVRGQGGSSVCNASMASNQQIIDRVQFVTIQSSINIESIPNYHDSFANQTAIFKPVSFVYGTSKTAYCDVEVSATAHEAETPSNSLDYSFTMGFQMTYDGQNTITLRQTIRNASTAISGNLGVRYNAIVGVSSKSALGDPLYIDLDIGEAYKEEDGDIISSNTGVYLPAELPTLNSGVNRITTSNTITKLDIVPRWWEV